MKNIKKSYFIIFGLIVLAVVCFSTSYAIFSNTKEEHGKLNIVAGNLNYKIESSELDSDSITLPANTSKEIRIKLTSLNEVSSKYELYYILDKTNDKVSVGYSKDTKDNVLGTVEGSSSKIISIVVRNDSDTSSKVTFKVLGGLINNNLALKDGNSLNKEVSLCRYEVGYVWNFDYTGSEQEFTAPCSGTYKLETWGAQGGGYVAIGGYGGYSIGNIILKSNAKLFVNVGESGKSSSTEDLSSTYNGGGAGAIQANYKNIRYFSSGGGATHIAMISGILSNLENEKNNILIVAGAGGGAYFDTTGGSENGGSAGGYIGTNGTQTTKGWGSFGYGGSQTEGGYSICDDTTCSANDWERKNYSIGGFGYGGPSSIDYRPSSGGGSGYYGGGGSGHVQSAGGGSSYIGNTSLYNKSMYCYNCEESTEESTKTISTTCTSETPTENCSKQGNGYARITYLGN